MLKTIIEPPLFAYSHDPVAPGAGSTLTPAIIISNDADFDAIELRGTINKAAAFDGSVLIQLSVSNGQLFSNVGIDALAFCANNISNYSGYPIRFNMPIKMPANSVINVQVTNNNSVALVSFQIQFWGYKVDAGEGYST